MPDKDNMLKRMAKVLTMCELEAVTWALYIAKDTGKQPEMMKKYGSYQTTLIPNVMTENGMK